MPTLTARLTGPQIGEAVEILIGLFDKNGLQELARTGLDLDLFAEVSQHQPLRAVASDLVVWLNQRQRVEELLGAACRARPRDAALRAFAARAAGGAGPSLAEPVRAVTDALDTAAQSARDDDGMREMIAVGESKLEETREELDRLARYKALHDCLHTLQLQLPAITRTARSVPADPSADGELLDYVRGLQSRTRQARQSAAGLFTADDEALWIDEFDDALARIRTTAAAAAAAAPDLMGAVAALGRLPVAELFRLNVELINAARRIGPGLKALAETLTALWERVECHGDESELVPRIRAGSDALFELGPRLAGLADAHDGWQWVDKELTAAEKLPPGPAVERVPRWKRVLARLDRICPRADDGAADAGPRALAARWEAEATAPTGEAVFHRLRAAARHEFKDVDDSLLDLADQLTRIIEPLDALLQVI